MAEESWHAARLIPTSGISGADEQERRATSALLAVMSVVREFGRAVLSPLGAPAGKIETFIEVPFQLGEKKFIPDGLVRVTRGARSWTALVEVKTGNNPLQADQLDGYLDVAREQGFDALVTISNEIPAVPGQHPATVDKRRLRKVALHHISWSQLLCEAVMQKEHRGVADPEQAWILGELIRYLEHPRSGAMMFDDMGSSWVPAREAVAAGTLRAADSAATEVALRFDALVRFACLQLGRQLGAEVTPSLSRKEIADPALRTQAQAAQLASNGTLTAAIRIPDTVGMLNVTADLRAGQVVCHIDVDAPREGRPTTRVNWLVRQMKNAPETVRVESFLLHSRGQGAAELLRDVRLRPELMVVDAKRDLRSFRIAQSFAMGAKRGSGRGGFIDSVLSAINQFYEEVVQNIKPWSALPPRIRPDESFVPPIDVPVALVSTAPSSQDGAEAVAPDLPTAGAL